MKREQTMFEHDKLIEAVHNEILIMSPQEVARLAGTLFSVRLYPIGSIHGQRYLTEDKIVNNNLVAVGFLNNMDEKAIAIIKEIKASSSKEVVFSKSMLALIKAGIHLSIRDLERTIAKIEV